MTHCFLGGRGRGLVLACGYVLMYYFGYQIMASFAPTQSILSLEYPLAWQNSGTMLDRLFS